MVGVCTVGFFEKAHCDGFGGFHRYYVYLLDAVHIKQISFSKNLQI